jgi:hypothetical protein
MKQLFTLVVIACLSASCSSINVSSDFDKNNNFAGYKTYALTEKAEQLPVDDINRARILRAIEKELAAEGFTKSAQPDVWIDVNLTAQQKQSATATSTGPGYYGYGAGYPYGWGPGFSSTQIHVENYVEGTLFVDMIDASKQQLVWQGRAVKTLDPDASPERREANINYAVQQIFLKYPPKPSTR